MLVFLIRLSGAMLIALGAAHVWIAKYLEWKSDAAKMTLVNRQIFWVHSFYIALLMTLLGGLSLLLPEALVRRDSLSRAVLAGMTLLWVLRLIIQWFVFDRSLWRNHARNRAVHFLLTAWWTWLSGVFGWGLVETFR